MSHIMVLSPKSLRFGDTTLRHVISSPRSERLELRVAELDLAHTIELKRLNKLLATAKQKLFSSGRQRD
jgi:hypothetical protein